MNKNIKTLCLSLGASICFFVSYFIHGGTSNLVLAFGWLCITAIIGFTKDKK